MTRETPAGPFLTLARPLKVGSERCLVCHSAAEKAPPTMTALYGSQNGFGWKLGEIVGAQIVSIPLTLPLARGYQAHWRAARPATRVLARPRETRPAARPAVGPQEPGLGAGRPKPPPSAPRTCS